MPVFAPVENPSEIKYRQSARQPKLFEALQAIVDEAIANGDVSPNWYSGNGETASTIRNAAKKHGFTANFGEIDGALVFRLNGRFTPRGPNKKTANK